MSAGDGTADADSDSDADGSVGGDLDLGDASNVLVLSPSMSERARQSYFDRLFPGAPAEFDVLAVDYRRSADQWVDDWTRHVDDRPQSVVVVSVDETTRSATASVTGTRYTGDAAMGIENPGDLTGLGIAVSEYLSEHEGPGTIVTFDSLTYLLQYVDLQRAFRFLHVLSNRVETADAVAHYHMDPAAHVDRAVITLASLFDAVVEFEDGEWSVSTR